MAPDPLAPESIARAVAALPVSLFIGSVSLPLNAEVTTLASELDPKITDIQAQIAATLELCHPGNEPSAGRLKDDVDDLRAGVKSIQMLAASLLNGTYVAPRARERLHRDASLSSFERPVVGQGDRDIDEAQPPVNHEFVLEL